MLGEYFLGKKLVKELISVDLGRNIIFKEQINAQSPEGLQKIQISQFKKIPILAHKEAIFPFISFLSSGIEIFGRLRPVWVIVSEPLE